jgi:hypothetical protein
MSETDKTVNEVLKEIHLLLAKDMLKRLQEGDLSSAEWTSAATFLKANNIQADPESNDELEGLRKEMEERRKRRGLSKDDKDDLSNVIQMKKG